MGKTDGKNGRGDSEIWNCDTEPLSGYSIQYLIRELNIIKQENRQLKKNMSYLLNKVGRIERCGGCGKVIFFVHQENGRWRPYNKSGYPHLLDCPKVKAFREKK